VLGTEICMRGSQGYLRLFIGDLLVCDLFWDKLFARLFCLCIPHTVRQAMGFFSPELPIVAFLAALLVS
jgi:hypothetical protein